MADELTGYNDCVFNAVSGNYYHHNDNESGEHAPVECNWVRLTR